MLRFHMPAYRFVALALYAVVAGAACSDEPAGPSDLADADSRSGEFAALGDAASGCHALTAAGSTFSNFALTADGPVPLRFFPLVDGGPPVVPGFQSDASVSLVIDGVDASAGLVVTTKLFGDTPRGQGTTHATTSHVFELAGSDGDSICEPGENCFETIDRTILKPTDVPGLLDLHGLLTFAAGHGQFADPDAHPNLQARGEIQFAPEPFPSVASWDMSGNFCSGS